MARITREEVEKIAALARLSLDDAEAARAASELEAILGYAELLSQVDTEGVTPTSHVLPVPTPLRDDRAEAPLDPEQVLANAPERDGWACAVPRVIESEEEG